MPSGRARRRRRPRRPAVDNPGAGAAAREEAARQGAWLAVMLVAVPLLIWVERKASDPDAWRTVKMRAAKTAERFCAQTAGEWWALAERARLAYEREQG
jgi:hypothetical protein